MPFGGLLGSTFNFVFENQLEAPQNGDRFYYLSRTAGLENDTFAELVMADCDATHMSANISGRRSSFSKSTRPTSSMPALALPIRPAASPSAASKLRRW
jgi:hypothetical protein